MLCLISDIRKDLLFPPLCHTYFCFPSWQPGQWTCPVGKNGNCYQFEQIRLPITSVQFSFVIIQGSHPKGSKNYDLPHSPKTWIVIQRKKPLTLLRTHLVIFFLCLDCPISPELILVKWHIGKFHILSQTTPWCQRKRVVCAHPALRWCPPLGVSTGSFHFQQIQLPIKQTPFTIAVWIKL